MNCERPRQPRLQFGKVRFVFLFPPVPRLPVDIAPFVQEESNVDVAVGSVITPDAATKQVDRGNGWRRLDPVGEDARECREIGIHDQNISRCPRYSALPPGGSVRLNQVARLTAQDGRRQGFHLGAELSETKGLIILELCGFGLYGASVKA